MAEVDRLCVVVGNAVLRFLLVPCINLLTNSSMYGCIYSINTAIIFINNNNNNNNST